MRDDPAALEARFLEALAATAARVDEALTARMGDDVGAGEIARPPRLMAAMRHGALGGGKRLRPFLLIATARLFGLEADAALPAAAALEMAHCYSLVHDDLPAMDDDDLRRGRPTVHRAFDEATAILAGDALLTLAFETLADPAAAPDPAIRAELVLTLARAAGQGGMVGGQMFDLAAEGRYGPTPAPPEAGHVRLLQAMKTGALLAASVEMGAILAGAGAGERGSLLAYGRALGAAFQVADDILDVEASSEDLGKAAGKDAGANKATLVAALGLAGARAERDRLAESAIAALASFGAEADLLRAAARFAAMRKS